MDNVKSREKLVKKTQVKTWLNAELFPDYGEVNNSPSLTVPDQTMSIPDILNRYAKGLPLDGQKIPIFEGEDSDMPDPRTLDLADRQLLAEEALQELKEIKDRANEKARKNYRDRVKAQKPIDTQSGNEKPKPDQTTV